MSKDGFGLEGFVGTRERARRWLTRFPRALPAGVFLLIAGITLFAVLFFERIADIVYVSQLHDRGAAIASALERRANSNSSYLRAGAALFSTEDEVPASRFRRFVSELQLDSDFRGAEGIGWAQRVGKGEEAEFNRGLAQDYGPELRLRPEMAADQPYAVPVTYLEPDSQFNRMALGYNMYSDADRRAAMDAAESTARPVASGKVTIVQERFGRSPGFLIYMPVYSSNGGGARLKGFVYSVFNAQEFLASALELESAGDFGVSVYDGEVGEENLLASVIPEGLDGPAVKHPVTIADHDWVLEVRSAPQAALSPLSMATLLLGLAVATLLTLIVRMLTRQASEDAGRLAWFEEQNAIRDSLTRELNHRVKNTLANVLSIVALTRRRSTSLDEFAEGIDGRIRALSATHDLLTQSEWGATPVQAVIEAELAPYARDVGTTIELEGPQVELAPSDALSLGLAIHELATNAAKYGSLSQPGGSLSIRWETVEADKVQIDWQESGGPPVPVDRKRGFGLDLIEKIVAHELQNPVEMHFDPEGVRCRLTVPVRERAAFAMREESGA